MFCREKCLQPLQLALESKNSKYATYALGGIQVGFLKISLLYISYHRHFYCSPVSPAVPTILGGTLLNVREATNMSVSFLVSCQKYLVSCVYSQNTMILNIKF